MMIQIRLPSWLRAFLVSCALGTAWAQPAPNGESQTIREQYPNGTPRLERTVRVESDGSKIDHGRYISYFADGSTAESGEYVDGERHGKWSAFFANGKPSATGEYDRGCRVGTWSVYAAPGKLDRTLSGTYKRTEYPLNRGYFATGSLLNGRPADRWIYRRSDRTIALIANYRNGQLDGDVVLIHADGTPDPEMTSGRYARGGRFASLPDSVLRSFERPRIALSALPPLAVPPTLGDDDVARTEKLISDFVSEDDVRYTAAVAALRKPMDRRVMPIVVNAMCRLEVDNEPQRRQAVAIRERILPKLTGGIALPAVPSGRTTDERLSILRARAICELALDDTLYFDFDLALRRTNADDRDRNPLLDPPWPALPLPPISDRAPLYAFRFPPEKGGKPRPVDKVEPMLGSALDWLVRHQDASGGFHPEYFSQHCSGAPCSGPGQVHSETFVTSLAVLALLGDPNPARRAANLQPIKKGLIWLLSHQDPGAGSFGDTATATDPTTGEAVVYESQERPRDTALAVTALCEAMVLFDRQLPTVQRAAQQGLDWLRGERLSGAGWTRNRQEGRSDSISTAHALIAIIAARAAGIIVANELSDEARTVLVDLTDPKTGRTGLFVRGSYSPRLPDAMARFAPERADYCTALTLTVRELFGELEDRPEVEKGYALLETHRPNWTPSAGNIDGCAWWYSSQAFALRGGNARNEWFEALLQSLSEGQANVGCATGSWDPVADAWGTESGRVYLTAVLALALESPWRYAP